MTDIFKNDTSEPIDAVIAWVDGSDPRLTEKRNCYLDRPGAKTHPGAHPTRFASVNEIRYCVLSILRFAPFIRNIYIITDGQDPNLNGDIKSYFPEKLKSVRIVDHTEIFEGFEKYLPTFNSISIGNMSWRIKGLSENFVYFNDDTFLIRDIKPSDWFVDNKPVIRGRWESAPLLRLLWYKGKRVVQRYLLNNQGYEPRASFHTGQWNSAYIAGMRFRYFTTDHTPHAASRSLIERFFNHNKDLLEMNISYRFRNFSQFTFIALSNHLQILNGNKHLVTPDVAYMQPHKRSSGYIDKKISFCETNRRIKFLCVQSLEMCSKEEQEKVFGWLDKILDLQQMPA